MRRHIVTSAIIVVLLAISHKGLCADFNHPTGGAIDWQLQSYDFSTTLHRYHFKGRLTSYALNSDGEAAATFHCSLSASCKYAPSEDPTKDGWYEEELIMAWYQCDGNCDNYPNLPMFWKFRTTGHWKEDPWLYSYPGMPWAPPSTTALLMSENNAPPDMVEYHQFNESISFPASLYAIPTGQREQLQDDAAYAPSSSNCGDASASQWSVPHIVSPPEMQVYTSGHVPVYFEVYCRFPDYSRNYFIVMVERRISDPGAAEEVWERVQLPELGAVKMKPSMNIHENRSFGNETFRIDTGGETALMRVSAFAAIEEDGQWVSGITSPPRLFWVGNPTVNDLRQTDLREHLNLPDLVIGSFDVEEMGDVSPPSLKFIWTIVNRGKQYSGAFRVKLDCTENQQPCDLSSLSSTSFPQLPAHPSAFFDLAATVPRTSEDRSLTFTLTLDELDEVKELNEGNNVESWNHVVPGLKVGSLAGVDGVLPAETISTGKYQVKPGAFRPGGPIPLSLPAEDTVVEFQQRTGNTWRFMANPRVIREYPATGLQGKVIQREYRIEDPGRYRYRVKTNEAWSEWFSLVVDREQMAGKPSALITENRQKILSGTRKEHTLKAFEKTALRPPRIISFSTGKRFSPDNQVTLKAEYDSSQKLLYLVERKEGGRYRLYKKTSQPRLGRLVTGDYRVRAVYEGEETVSEWVEFTVKAEKQLKKIPPGTPQINPDEALKTRPKVNLGK